MSHEHRADGRLRLAAALLVSIVAALSQSLDTLSIMLGFALLAALLLAATRAGVGKSLIRRMLTVNVIVIAIWLTVPIDWPTLAWHDEGIVLATQMSLRINVITLAVSMLLMQMSGIDLARAAIALGLPQSLGTLLALAVRQIAVLAETRNRLEQAMRARAYRARVGWRTLRVSAQLVAWLIVHAIVRAERFELGLKARGLTATRWPTRRSSPWRSLPGSEWALLCGLALALTMAVWLPRIWS
jgi:cobalt/nickel transport system permease protein